MRSWSWVPVGLASLALATTSSMHTPASGSSQEAAKPWPGSGKGGGLAALARGGAAAAELAIRTRELGARIDKAVVNRTVQLPGARVGIAVLDIQSGLLLYERDGHGLFNTASNTKLVTASAALAMLGPDFRYYTAVYGGEVAPDGVLNGDLHIRGRGDPSLTTSDLYNLARELKQRGITRIQGGVVVDAEYFDTSDLPPHFEEKPDDQAPYRAPIGATSLNFNAFSVSLRPAAGGRGPSQVRVEPPNDYIKVESAVQTVTSGRTRIRLERKITRDTMYIRLLGQLRVDDGAQNYRQRVADPVRYLGAALRTALVDSGIQVARKEIKTGEVPKEAQALAWRVSEPLAVLVRGLGKYSNNYVAEMVLKTVGAERRTDRTRPATWDDGLSAVRTWLVDTVGWPPDGYYYGNGSGLFASNRFSPAQLVKLLAAAHRDFRYGPDLLASLSIAGVDGTISRRMAAGPAAGLVRAKTGTLDGVSTLSGYVAVDGRSPLAFAILVNGHDERAANHARILQNEVCEATIPFLAPAAP